MYGNAREEFLEGRGPNFLSHDLARNNLVRNNFLSQTIIDASNWI